MFKITTKFYFDKGLKIAVDQEVLRYYMWQIARGPKCTLGQQLPMRKAHISVILPRIHGKDITRRSQQFADQEVEITCTGDIHQGGSWFTNYWVMFNCVQAEQVKALLGVHETNFLGYHLTVCNNKGRINELYPEAAVLAKEMNDGKYTVGVYRQKMVDLLKK